jgi:hypothetical protein
VIGSLEKMLKRNFNEVEHRFKQIEESVNEVQYSISELEYNKTMDMQSHFLFWSIIFKQKL